MLPINRNPAPRELQQFRRIWLPLFVVVVTGLAWWRLGSPLTALVVGGIGGLLVVTAALSTERARTIFVGLQTIMYPVGFVISMVALALLFYVLFTLIGWGMRLVGRDPLRLRARAARSHWMPYKQDDEAEHAFRQF